LDRWALNSPDELKKLEAKGDIAFMVRLNAPKADAQTKAAAQKELQP
jgi:hypothetical protein